MTTTMSLWPSCLSCSQASRGKPHPGSSCSKFEPPFIPLWCPWSHPNPQQDMLWSQKQSIPHQVIHLGHLRGPSLAIITSWKLLGDVLWNIFCLMLTACRYSLKLTTTTSVLNMAYPNHVVRWTTPYECTALAMTLSNQHTKVILPCLPLWCHKYRYQSDVFYASQSCILIYNPSNQWFTSWSTQQ